MKKFAILFAALCMVAFMSSESSAQCRGGGGYYGGGGYGGGSYYRNSRSYYRPSVGYGYGYGNYARPYYGTRYGSYRVPYSSVYRGYGGSYYRGGSCGRGVSIRF